MRLRVFIKRFFVRYVDAARNDNEYRNFLRNTRRKTLELKYDLKELEDLYRRKEIEKRIELKKNIADLQQKKDRLQKEYDEQNKRDSEEIMAEYLKRREFFENKSDALINKLEELELKRIALEREIMELEKQVPSKTEDKKEEKTPKKKGIFKRVKN